MPTETDLCYYKEIAGYSNISIMFDGRIYNSRLVTSNAIELEALVDLSRYVLDSYARQGTG